MKTEVLRLEWVAKFFDGMGALRNINLTLYKGEILGVLGLNGSGKSRIVELLAGNLTADRGRIFVNEEAVTIQSQSGAQKLGIYCIRQATKLVPGFTVAENIFVIRENRSGRVFTNTREICRQTSELLERFGLNITPNTITGTLSSLEQHLVEIAKAVNEGARIIVLDDVTDDYSPKDFEVLKNRLRVLCQDGLAVLFVSRRWEGMMELSDRITVLRDGTTVRTLHRDEYTKQKLVKLLTGRNFDESFLKKKMETGEEVLSIANLTTDGMLKEVNLNLHRGEILSLLDMEGEFSHELVQALLGERSPVGGTIWLRHKRARFKNYRHAVQQGIGLIPETWANNLFINLSITDNLSFLVYRKMSRGLFINSRLLKFVRQTFFQTFRLGEQQFDPLSANDLDQTDRFRILIYRWLLRRPHVLIMIKPSLRIDLVARQNIYKLIESLAAEGIAILLIATDLAEAVAISDRAIIIQNEKMQGEYSYQEIQELTLEDVS